MKKLTEERKNEIIGVIIIFCGLIFAINLYSGEGGVLGEYIITILKRLIGDGINLLPFLIFFWGYRIIKMKRIILGNRSLGYILIAISFLTFHHQQQSLRGAEIELALNGGGGGLAGGFLLRILRILLADAAVIVVLLGLVFLGLFWISEKDLKSFVKGLLPPYQDKVQKLKKLKFESDDELLFESHFITEDTAKTKSQRFASPPEDIEILTTAENEEPSFEIEEDDDNEAVIASATEAEKVSTAPKKIKKPFFAKQKTETTKPKRTIINYNQEYSLPSPKLLDDYSERKKKVPADQSKLLEKTLNDFGIKATVVELTHGPRISRYEVHPSPGVKVSRIVGLANDIALALAAEHVRIEAPIPGKSALGIEVPHNAQQMIGLRRIVEAPGFKEDYGKLPLVLGLDISGRAVIRDLSKMPHLLIAGATGSGKSVCINNLILSLLFRGSPEEIKLLLIDPKQVELTNYRDLPHLVAPIITNAKKASGVLTLIVEEMEKRYKLFSESLVRDIDEYNEIMALEDQEQILPSIVVIIDELADMMMVAANEVEDSICRLAQKARAAGIHLIIATQRPSVDIITGLIKANVPSRISFYVSSQIDSRTILDSAGAEKLMGHGDMLFSPVGAAKPIRIQAPYVSNDEVKKVVSFLKDSRDPDYIFNLSDVDSQSGASNGNGQDELFPQAVRMVCESEMASITMLQRRLNVGYNRAARLIDQMELEGIVGPYAGTKARTVYIQKADLEEYLAKLEEG